MPPAISQDNAIEDKSPHAKERCRPASHLLRNFLASGTALTLTTLSATYLTSFYIPWRALAATEIPEWIVGYTERIANTLNSREDLGIGTLGSSLILAVIEDKEGKVSQLCRNSIEANTGSAQKLSIFASPGNLISDYEKLVAAMLDRPPTMQPKLILLTYSYRDFFDNLAQSDENASPVAKMLNYTRERGHFLPDWQKLFSRAALDETATCLLHHKRHLHSVAALFRTTLAQQAEQLRKNYLVQAPKQNTHSQTAIPKLDLQTDMKVYKTRYQPLNETRWHSQLQALDRLLQHCRQRNIPVAMVNMPVTDANLSLLPSEMKDKWQAPIRALAQKHGAALKDFDEGDAAGVIDTDFADSVHLNQDGARKFADRLFRWLGSTKQYQSAFKLK